MTAKEVTGGVWSAEFANDSSLRGKAPSITQPSELREKRNLLKPQQLATPQRRMTILWDARSRHDGGADVTILIILAAALICLIVLDRLDSGRKHG
jgi:hypothetical protein